MLATITEDHLWPGATYSDVQQFVTRLTGRGFDVKAAPAKTAKIPWNESLGKLLELAAVYEEIRPKTEQVVIAAGEGWEVAMPLAAWQALSIEEQTLKIAMTWFEYQSRQEELDGQLAI